MQREYCVLERAASNDHPLLGWDQSGSAFYKGKPVHVSEPVRLRLAEPVPPKPVMVDHHSLPKPVLSPRLKEALEPVPLHRVQWVPADVRVAEGDVRRYWLLHVHNELRCMNRQESVFKLSPSGLTLLSLERLVLDESVLSRMPLDERRIFVLAESPSTCLFHQSVVDRVMSLTPPAEGLRFIPVPDWNDSAGFR
ncbi:hypothetical protein HPC49_25325 [Pyxidicoccus fallax]|uniref:Immunity MXAN-0049 protein domain-containing protein n=1 Tax=Pyxidicoccus fallax TaxID=394095 RepID=A0A848LNI4_9BACT|nr:DUF1629 domain-containing protein [Pyxidicoccus fallax]NMO19173.1 hypothetical protein [Pyxidicoccus fallax]NPC81533.1 hypothetical protein [Pyxidicoccus fallax]